tara:strand:+ start:141 stop:569 length:429 start_codon:yes stop_codon:yes gene_type:complete
MCEIEVWFKECDRIFVCGGFEFSILNGFKITHYIHNDKYTIQDTRKNDFYTTVSKEDYSIIREYGFVRGTGIIMQKRNVQRVEHYLNKIAEAFSKKKLGKKKLTQDFKFYSKQIKNCDIKIHKYNDLVHFYKSKVKQFETKY